MKKTLLIALMIACCMSASAQKIELGLNGGLAPYIWADNTFKNYEGSKQNNPGYYGSLRLSFTMIGWQVGAGFDMFQTGVKTSILDTTSSKTFKNTTKYSTITPYLFLNKIFKLPKSYIYAGLNGGYNTGSSKTTIEFISILNSTAKYSGFTGGAQIGYTLNLVKGLGANAEAAARYVQMTPETITGAKGASTYHLIFPVSLGIRYTF